jgi:reactive intermediate/imine deaminase
MLRTSQLTPALAIALALSATAFADVVRIEITDRSAVLDGKSFGAAGPYVRIIGKVHFAVDPELPANRAIADITLAPRNAEGRVEFSSDLYLLRPRDASRGNGTVLLEIGNRGRKGLLSTFNLARGSLDPRTAQELGDGFLLEQGYTLAWLGWQADVHDHLEPLYTDVKAGTPPDPHLMRFHAPVATEAGKPITGWVRSDFIPDRKSLSFHLADRTHKPYLVVEPDHPGVRLTVRDRRDAPRQTIPRELWQFAREENGKPVPSRAHVYMANGFEAGRIYEMVYRSQDPVVVGLGLAAVRDFVSFLKYGSPRVSPAEDGPDWSRLQRAIGFGSSQSGRFLRTYVYFGFNQDERRRPVFDGIWSHVGGGGRGSFNHRFAQPSRDARPFFNFFYPTDIFPFSDVEQTDPETGRTEGLLSRSRPAGAIPRIFNTNSSYEYYGRAASLIHTTLDGRRDVAPDPSSRIYLIAGAEHGPGRFPPGRGATQNASNANDYRWTMRALLVAMQQWVEQRAEPPASQYPTIAKGQLVPLESLNFPKIPGVAIPTRIHTAFRVDYGPEFLSKGIVSQDPPRVGKPFPTLVPQVDPADGNEISGIRLPVVRVPLASHTGWNLRHPDIGAPDELYSMTGSFIPFAATREQRLESGDPRASIEERYKDRQDYIDRISAAARELAGGRYLLQRDIAAVIEQAGRQWDHYMKPRVSSAGAAATANSGASKRVIAPPGPAPVGPYSPGILAGDFLYVSGQGGRDRDGTLPPTIDGQARQTLQNVKSIVEAAGLTMAHVVYSQVYLSDMAHYDAMDQAWRAFFPRTPPARAVVGVHRLPTDIAVEINAVAFRDLSRRKPIAPAGYPPNLSWSPGVMAGGRLYLSGFMGADVATGRMPESPDAQVQLALDNMKQTLAAAGMDFRHVVFVNPYLTATASREMNAIYAKHFEFGNTPARATIRVTSLPGGNTIAFTGVAIADLSKRRAVRPKNMNPSATASPCVFADATYYCSAKGPFTPGPAKVQGIYASTIEAQVRQTMRNLLDGLEEAQLDFSHVVATNVYLDDMNDFARMNRIYAQYFSDAPPTRTTVAHIAPADRTPRDSDTYPALEQISLIAVK